MAINGHPGSSRPQLFSTTFGDAKDDGGLGKQWTLEHLHQLPCHMGIHRTQGVVQQHEIRLRVDRTGQRDALLLTTCGAGTRWETQLNIMRHAAENIYIYIYIIYNIYIYNVYIIYTA